MKEQVRHPLPRGESAEDWAQDTDSASWASTWLCFCGLKTFPALSTARALCDPHSVIPDLTPLVLLRFAQQPEALPSLASPPASPRPSCGVSSSSWRLDTLVPVGRLTHSSTPARWSLCPWPWLSQQRVHTEGLRSAAPPWASQPVSLPDGCGRPHWPLWFPGPLPAPSSWSPSLPGKPSSSRIFKALSGVRGPSQLFESSYVPFSAMSSCTPKRYTVVSPDAICLQTLFGPNSHQ